MKTSLKALRVLEQTIPLDRVFLPRLNLAEHKETHVSPHGFFWQLGIPSDFSQEVLKQLLSRLHA